MTILTKDHHCNAIVTLNDGTEIEIFANQLLDKNLHYWKGWYCNAGVDRIVINDDFSVHSGRCLNDYLGNLLNIDTGTPGDFLRDLESARERTTSPLRIEALSEAQQFPGSRMVAGERGTQAVPEYAAPVLDALSAVRSGESGRTSAVQSVVNHVYGEIMRPGQPISAAQLYGLRKELADKLERPLAMSDELGASVKASAAMTKKIIQGIDNALDNASNGKFSKYLEDYQEASRPVDSARAEQNLLAPI